MTRARDFSVRGLPALSEADRARAARLGQPIYDGREALRDSGLPEQPPSPARRQGRGVFFLPALGRYRLPDS